MLIGLILVLFLCIKGEKKYNPIKLALSSLCSNSIVFFLPRKLNWSKRLRGMIILAVCVIALDKSLVRTLRPRTAPFFFFKFCTVSDN